MAKTLPKPRLDHIIDLLAPTVSSGFLKGQLVVEGILLTALKHRLEKPELADLTNMKFYASCSLCAALGLVDEEMLGLLRRIGKIRNDMAHKLDYNLEFHEAFDLARMAKLAGVDFSDDTIAINRRKAEEWYSVEDIVQEVFQNLAQDLVLRFDPELDGMFAEFHS